MAAVSEALDRLLASPVVARALKGGDRLTTETWPEEGLCLDRPVYGSRDRCKHCGQHYPVRELRSEADGGPIYAYWPPDDCCSARAVEQHRLFSELHAKAVAQAELEEREWREAIALKAGAEKNPVERERLMTREYRERQALKEDIIDFKGSAARHLERARQLKARGL
jgi:hypothetical protein